MRLRFSFIKAYLYLAGTNFLILPNIVIFSFYLLSLKRFKTTPSAIFIFLASIFGIFGSFFSEKPFISIVFISFIFSAYWVIDKLSESLSSYDFYKIISNISIINLILCLIQLRYPNFIVVPHSGSWSYLIPASALIYPYIPFLPRLSGIFVENGPMVSTLLIFTFYQIFSRRLGILNLSLITSSFKIYISNLLILLNICLIFFTGSKISFFLLLFTFLFVAYKFLLPLFRSTFVFLSRKFFYISPFIIILMFLLFLVFTQYIISNLNSGIQFVDYLSSLQSLLRRLEIPNLDFFSGVGFGSTTKFDLNSLNAFYIYSQAFGILWGLGFLLFFTIFLLYPFPHLYLVILLFASYISVGSLLMYNYPILLIASRLLSPRSCSAVSFRTLSNPSLKA